MKVTLPGLITTKKVGSRTKKNIIKHRIFNEVTMNVTPTSQSKASFEFKDDYGNIYYATENKKDVPKTFEYVLLYEKVKPKGFLLLKWLKHPLMKKYDPNDIVKSWHNQFTFKQENQGEDILGLRTPQIGAIHTLLGHLTIAKEIATVVLPTGTGKTETMLSLLVANPCKKLLVTVPSDSLRTQLADKFLDFGLLKVKDKNGNMILGQTAQNPIIGVLNTSFNTEKEVEILFKQCNVIISTMNLVSGSSDEQIQIMTNLTSHLFVDEAHHSKAGNWDKFIKCFGKEKVIQFTATPYRNDGKMLDGRIIYNFTLKEAQDQGYFKEIDFIPIREYDKNIADIKMADVAVQRLREDLADGKEHILMARCENQSRSEEIYKIYSKYQDLNPILIHSNVENKRKVKADISNKKHQIIVCVDMLGEGFDLPELKIAVFHDIRKSLPITLQFAGRFTRTSRDAKLGKASFVANLHQPNIDDEIGLLYVKQSNWNSILPTLSLKATQQQIDLQDFLSGFNRMDESQIPFQEIRPAFSAVAYKNATQSWNPKKFSEGIKGYQNYDHKYYSINSSEQTLIVFLGNKKNVDWGNFKDVYDIVWNIFIIYWEQKNNILFIHSSEKGSEFKELAKAVIGDEALLIKEENVFRSFYNIDRVKLYNVGLRKGLGKNITFQSYYGKGVQEALSLAEEKSGINNNVFGVGFENGNVTSIGCSRKGRIWSYSRGTINEFIEWCKSISNKLSNSKIDANKILLENAIKPTRVSKRPDIYPLTTDWHPILYKDTEDSYIFKSEHKEYDLSNTELNIKNPDFKSTLEFTFDTDDFKVGFKLELSKIGTGEKTQFNYNISKVTGPKINVIKGAKVMSLEEFLNEYPPIIWFADGSYLQGNDFVNFNEEILLFPKDRIKNWQFTGVNLNEESENFKEIRTTSIQYYCFQELLSQKYDIIYNDDNSGEIADIIAIKDLKDKIEVEFYHLKFAIDGKISNQIKNFYEVCGQAQKSLVWKYKEGTEFVTHLIRREWKKNKVNQTRLKKGTIDDLENLLGLVKRTKPVEFKIYIVQPGVAKTSIPDDILHLLGVTANHIKKQGNIELEVITS